MRARDGAAGSRIALETLCRTYRAPVLAYVRGHVHAPGSAEDLTQAFFMRFLEREWHAAADPGRGRFRTFLLTALKRFLVDADAEARAQKRGGRYRFESLDEDGAPPVTAHGAPEQNFDRAWAAAVLDAAWTRLRGEAERAGKRELFERLSEFLVEAPDESDYTRVAAALGLRRNTLAVAVHRLRRRLRELVREELAETVDGPEALEQELRALRGALRSEP